MPQGIEETRVLVWYLFIQNPCSGNWYTGLNQVTRKGGRRDTKETKGLVWTLELRN